MPNTARSHRCRKCHTSYDSARHQRCPRCGAPSRPSSPSVTPAGPPTPKPKKERMTPLMKVAAQGAGLVYGTPSILDPTQTKHHEKRQANNTPIVIGSVVGIVVIVALALAMGNKGGGKKSSSSSPPAQPPPVAQPPAPQQPAPPPPPEAQPPDDNLDPLDRETRDRHPQAAQPGSGSEGASNPPPRRSRAEWKVDPAVKAELEPKLREMNDWPTAKIEAEKKGLAARGREVIPALIELIDNDDEMAAKYACEILQYITGTNKGSVMGTSRDDRKALRDVWKETYQEHEGCYDAGKQRTDEQVLDLGLKWAGEYKKAPFAEAQEAVAKQICATGDKDIVTGLIMVVAGDDKVLGPKAHDCLGRLTGQDMGMWPEDGAGRKDLAGKWDAWWKANRDAWQFPSK